MKTVLVATDLSERSTIALHRAAWIARTHDATLHVLHAVDGACSPTLREGKRIEAEAAIRADLVDLAQIGPLGTNVSVTLGDPCEEVAKLAREIGADLIVMGRHRHRGLIDVVTGTTVARMARSATLPLLVATRAPDGPYTKAVVGIDVSACAAKAVAVATGLIGTGGLWFVHCYRVPFKAFTMRSDRHGAIPASDRARVEAEIGRQIEAWITAFGVECAAGDVRLREGSAIDLLPRAAAEAGADLICLGAHGRSWVPEAFLGSTAAELLSYSDFDILIAPF